MFEVDFLLCLINGPDFNITVGCGRYLSCYAMSDNKTSLQKKCYDAFKVHENSNRYNSGPGGDIEAV